MNETTRLKNNERARLWRLANPERNRENRRKWREANPDKRRAADKRYRLAHADQERARVASHQKAHPEQAAARQMRYKERHPEKRDARLAKLRAYFATPEGKLARVRGGQRRRARMAGAEVKATARQVSEMLMSATACHYCEQPFGETTPATLDHVIPLAKGGHHTMDNLVPACGPCNSKKGAKLPDEFTGANVTATAFGDFT